MSLQLKIPLFFDKFFNLSIKSIGLNLIIVVFVLNFKGKHLQIYQN